MDIANIEEMEPITPHPKAPKNTSFDLLLKLKEKHPKISQRHLGKLVGISSVAVSNMFQRHGVDYDTGQVTDIENYKVNRADILALKQVDCLRALSPKKLKEATAQQIATTFGILHDKERLDRGVGQAPAVIIYASAVEMAFIQAKNSGQDQPVIVVSQDEQRNINGLQSQQRALVEIDDSDSGSVSDHGSLVADSFQD